MKSKILKVILIIISLNILIPFNYVKAEEDGLYITKTTTEVKKDENRKNYYSDNELNTSMIIFIIIIILLSVISYIIFVNNQNKLTSKVNNKQKYKILTNNEIKKLDSNIDINKFIPKIFEKYINIRKSINDYNFLNIKPLVSKTLYNNLTVHAKKLKEKDEQEIYNNFEYINGGIIDITKKDNKEIIKLLMNISYKNYIINIKTKEVTYGSKDIKEKAQIVITLEKTLNDKLKQCPNCKEKNDPNTFKCNKCGLVFDIQDNYLITGIKLINHKWQ